MINEFLTTTAQTSAQPAEGGDSASLALVICTRNNARRLPALFDALSKLQCNRPWEFVLVDNGSTDGTRALIESLASRVCAPLRYAYEQTPGLGNARNAGVRATSNDVRVIAFTDDDCYPRPDFLEAVERCFREDPTLAFLGGQILLHDARDLPITIQTRRRRRRLRAGSFVRAGLIHGANFSCRKQAVLAVGGFDPLFGHGAMFCPEDVDMQARLLAAGFHGLYDPRPVVYHAHGRRGRDDARKIHRVYDYGRGAYFMKCLGMRGMAARCLVHWAGRMLRQHPARSWRELQAGMRYRALARSGLAQPLATGMPEQFGS